MKENSIVANIRKFTQATDKLAVAVSGGIDSMVLLHAVMNAGVLDKKSYFVVNIEHGIRGGESVADSKFVEDFCRGKGITFRGFSVDAIAYSRENGLTTEEGARALRYAVFQKLLDDGECSKVALAHHRADQAETVLMRILRGTGMAGLQGMKEENGGFIRPLLDVPKREIEEYQKEFSVPYVTDSTNFDNAYTRNCLRNEIIPAMNNLSQGVEGALVRLARLAAENEDFISSFDNPVEKGKDYAAMELIAGEHPLLFKRRVRKCFSFLGVTQDVEERHADLVCNLQNMKNGASLDMPYGVKVTKEYDRLVFTRNAQNITFNEGFRTGKISLADKTVVLTPYKGESLKKGELLIDIAEIPSSAVFRNRREGDRFTKFSGGTKSLGDYLTDKKIPLRLRDSLALCADGQDVLFIAGVEIGNAVKLTDHTKKENVYKVYTED